jgi:hypothetical protein
MCSILSSDPEIWQIVEPCFTGNKLCSLRTNNDSSLGELIRVYFARLYQFLNLDIRRFMRET